VIVPTYNRADTLITTLQSVREQSFTDVEVLVIDDGSTDETRARVEALHLPRLIYEWQANAGPSVARNRGAELATGEFLAFLDTDDVVHADWLATFDTMIRAYGSELVSCGADFTRDRAVLKSTAPRRLGPGAGGVIAFFRAGCFTVRRDRFDAVGGFDPVLWFSEVSELGMRIGQSLSGRANAVTHVTRSLVSVELPAGDGLGGRSTSNSYSDQRRLETAEYILEKHAAVMERTPTLRQTYLRVAGVASARLGSYRSARRYFLKAWGARPRAGRELARAAATAVPGLRTRLWPSMG
jgi:glycosyltransferase involved in cell wall biosynthesis